MKTEGTSTAAMPTRCITPPFRKRGDAAAHEILQQQSMPAVRSGFSQGCNSCGAEANPAFTTACTDATKYSQMAIAVAAAATHNLHLFVSGVFGMARRNV